MVGVGGSGKQSLTRLAASVAGLEVFQIQLRKGYSITDLKTDLAQLYMQAGVKNIGTVFLLTDAQVKIPFIMYTVHVHVCVCVVILLSFTKVPDEKFLVLINDLLASGEIPGLFADDELDGIISKLGNECKAAGIQDTRENVWKFFIDRVRRQLKVGQNTRQSCLPLLIIHVFIQGGVMLLSCWIYSESTWEKVPCHCQLYLYRLVSGMA